MTVSPGGRFVVCGSYSGIVNVYETEHLSARNNAPRPTKILCNLTTSATSVKFNSSAEILAMASDEKDSALRLVSVIIYSRLILCSWK